MNELELQRLLGHAQQAIQALQDELSQTNQGLVALAMELEDRVAARTSELREAHAELERTNAELMQLTLDLENRVAQRTAELRLEIAQRTEAENAVRESGWRLRQVLAGALDGVIMIDGEGRILEFNPAAVQIFGYRAEDAVGKELAELIVPLGFREAHRKGLARYRETAVGPLLNRQIEMPAIRADGSEFPIELAIIALSNEPLLFTAFARDITERKQAERILEQRVAERTQELAALNRSLEAAKEDAERANRTKDRFLASLSHELRTPLNSVIGFTGILLMKSPGPLTANQEQQLKTIKSSATHLLSLINDLLDLAKIEAGRVELSLEPVACHSVVQEVVTSLLPLAEAKGLRLAVELPADEVSLQTDRRALTQILLNLANNAIKFTEHGEVRLQVCQYLSNGQTTTEIRVMDTGIGIRPEDQVRLFQAFEQAGEARKGRQQGTGLGLHLSQKLASLLGGHVQLRSEYGQGSTFTLVLTEK